MDSERTYNDDGRPYYVFQGSRNGFLFERGLSQIINIDVETPRCAEVYDHHDGLVAYLIYHEDAPTVILKHQDYFVRYRMPMKNGYFVDGGYDHVRAQLLDKAPGDVPANKISLNMRVISVLHRDCADHDEKDIHNVQVHRKRVCRSDYDGVCICPSAVRKRPFSKCYKMNPPKNKN